MDTIIQRNMQARKTQLTAKAQAALEVMAKVERVADLEPGSIAESLLDDWARDAATNPRELIGWIEGGFDLDPETWPEHRAALESLDLDTAPEPPPAFTMPDGATFTRPPETRPAVTLPLVIPGALYERLDAATVNHNAMTGPESWTDLQGWIIRALQKAVSEFETWSEAPAVNLVERALSEGDTHGDRDTEDVRLTFCALYCNYAGFVPDHPLRKVPLSDWHKQQLAKPEAFKHDQD